jgi:hypothetical protein
MRRNYRNLAGRTVWATLLLAGAVQAQEHKWAGRTLDEFEWSVHERLAALPLKWAFETVNFEVRGSSVILSGQVLRESLKEKAERAVGEVKGVGKVVNKIEVLPPSRRDDVLRVNVYRAIYKSEPGTPMAGDSPQVHIIVKDGWVRLEGAVDSDAARDAIHLQALRVTSFVSDHLRVAPGQRGL